MGNLKIPITILIADDDEDDRMLTRDALEQAHISSALQFVEDGGQLLDYLAEKIFKMFERLHGRTRYEGSGIGLAICKRIVERHGGIIAATSTAGQDATFTVILPVKQTEMGSMS